MRAVEIIKSCHNVYIEFVPEPSIDSIAAKIRLYALQKDIEYVFMIMFMFLVQLIKGEKI